MLDIYIDFLIKDATKDTYYWHSWFTQKERYKAAAYFAYYLFKLRAKYKETSPIFFLMSYITIKTSTNIFMNRSISIFLNSRRYAILSTKNMM